MGDLDVLLIADIYVAVVTMPAVRTDDGVDRDPAADNRQFDLIPVGVSCP